MGIWDYLFSLADPRHPRIQREGQDFVASNPPGPAGSALRVFSQNLAKNSPNTKEVLDQRAKGDHADILWVSPQPSLGEPSRQRPVAVAKVHNQRGRLSGEIRDLTKPDNPVIARYPEEIDFQDLVNLARQDAETTPDRAKVFVDSSTGERYATTQPVNPSQARPVRQTTMPPNRGRTSRRGF